jgi:hypothetical protein
LHDVLLLKLVILRTSTEQSGLATALLAKVRFVKDTELAEGDQFVEKLQEAMRVIQDLHVCQRHRHLMELRCERSRYSVFLVIRSAAGGYILKRIEVYQTIFRVRDRYLAYEHEIKLAK